MATERFLASVQYNDWEGRSAADSPDINGPSNWLAAKGHKKADEFLLGISLSTKDIHGVYEDPVSVEFLLASPADHDKVKAKIDLSQEPIEVKKVSIEMNLNEFFSLFKRFSITLSSHGMLDERDYTYADL